MKFLPILLSFLTIFSLTYVSHILAETEISSEENEVLKELDIKVGESSEELKEDLSEIEDKISQSEIDGVNLDELSNTEEAEEKLEDFKDGLESTINETKEEIRARLEKEKRILTKAAKQEVIPGMGASMLSLFTTALVGPYMAFTCLDQHSVKLYSAAAVFYMVNELKSWKKFKAGSMLALERVESVNFTSQNSIRENVDKGINFAHGQLDYLEAQLKIAEEGFKAIEKKAKNAKLVSYGYTVAGALALYETIRLDGGICKSSTGSTSKIGRAHV